MFKALNSQIYLLLIGQMSDQQRDVKSWDRDHGFGESRLLLKDAFLNLGYS